MTSFVRGCLVLALVACGNHGDERASPPTTPAPGGTAAPASVPDPSSSADPSAAPSPAAEDGSGSASEGAARQGPAARDLAGKLSQLADLPDGDLGALRLELTFQGAPVDRRTKRFAISIDGESFVRWTPGPDGALRPYATRKTGPHSFREVLEAMRRYEIEARRQDPDRDCAGGQHYTLEVTFRGETTKLYAYDCGGTITGALGGDVKALLADMDYLVDSAERHLPRNGARRFSPGRPARRTRP